MFVRTEKARRQSWLISRPIARCLLDETSSSVEVNKSIRTLIVAHADTGPNTQVNQGVGEAVNQTLTTS